MNVNINELNKQMRYGSIDAWLEVLHALIAVMVIMSIVMYFRLSGIEYFLFISLKGMFIIFAMAIAYKYRKVETYRFLTYREHLLINIYTVFLAVIFIGIN